MLLAQAIGGGYSLIQILIIVIAVAAAIAIVYVIVRAMGVPIPGYLTQVGGILLAAFIGIIALVFLFRMIGRV